MATAFAGLRGTGQWGTDERPKSFRENILWFNPNGVAPIFALTSAAKTEPVDDPEFAWWEEKLQPLRLQIFDSTGYAAGSTTFTVVDSGLRAKAGDVFRVELATQSVVYSAASNEFLEVSSVTNDTTLVFKRGAAGTTAAAIAASASQYLTLVGSAYQEGGNVADPSQRNPTKIRNYTQIFKSTVAITRTAEKTHARTGNAFSNDKKRKMFDHAMQIEMALLFGIPYEDTSGNFPKRFTAGLEYLITTNRTIFSTTPTEDTLIDALAHVFDYEFSEAGNERIVFAGNGFLNAFNKIVRHDSSTRINYDKEASKLWGMSLNRFTTPQGSFMIRSHPLLNLHGRFTNSAFVLDPSALKYRPLKDSDTKFEDHTETNGKDSHEGQWITEAGFELHGESLCAYIGNFTYP